MYNSNPYLLSAYGATPEVLQALLRNYSPKNLTTVVKTEEDEWSVGEVICHLRDTDEASLKRTRLMRNQINPQLTTRDPAKLAIDSNYAATPLDSALSAFLRFRSEHIEELNSLHADEWERTGQYPSGEQISIHDQIIHLLAHDAIHLAQIARQLNAE